MKKAIIFIITLLLMVAIAGVLYFKLTYNKAFENQKEHIDPLEEKNINFEGTKPLEGVINILLLGSDARDDHELSDTLMIGQYNSKQKTLKLASIMRDTYINIPEYGYYKINAAYALGGADLVRKTVEENFDIPINYYAIVDFKAFPKVVDLLAPNGIEVDIPYEMSHGIGMVLSPGKQVLKGEQVLAYVRFRHDAMSDFGRVERQQEIISKLKNQAVSVNTVTSLPQILGTLDAYVATNVDMKTMLGMGTGLALNNFGDVETLRIPLDDAYTDGYYEAAGQVLEIDLEANKKALQDFLSPTPKLQNKGEQ